MYPQLHVHMTADPASPGWTNRHFFPMQKLYHTDRDIFDQNTKQLLRMYAMMKKETHPHAFPNYNLPFEDDYLALVMDQWGVDRTSEEIGHDVKGKHARVLNQREMKQIGGGHSLSQLIEDGADPADVDDSE